MGCANLSRISSGLFPKGGNDTPVDFLTNDHWVLNTTFVHVILIRYYGLDLFNHTVTWYRRFFLNRGYRWIIVDRFFNNFKKFILLLYWHTRRDEKMSDVMGLTKIDLSMIVFVSWYYPPKTPLLQILFLEMSLYCLKKSLSRPLL